MINYKRITTIFALIFFCILVSYSFFSKNIVNGMMAGYWTGVFNFFVITFIVKKFFGIINNEMVSSKVAKMLVVYLLKIAFFAIVIFLVVVNRQIFSIIGFLIGFTFTVIIIFMESLILKKV